MKRYLVAFSVSAAVLIPISTGLTRAVYAQNNATAPAVAGQNPVVPRIDPIVVAVAAVNPTDSVKTQIDGIIEKYRKEREALSPALTTGAQQGRPPFTPEQREKLATLEGKEIAEIKAALPTDQQAKFQTAYDAAKITQTSAPILALLSERLSLTEDEKTKITPIVAEFAEQSQKLRQDSSLDRDARREKQTALWEATKAKIRPLLPTEKQTTLDGITLPRGGRPGGNGAPNGQ